MALKQPDLTMNRRGGYAKKLRSTTKRTGLRHSKKVPYRGRVKDVRALVPGGCHQDESAEPPPIVDTFSRPRNELLSSGAVRQSRRGPAHLILLGAPRRLASHKDLI